jgi:hypothetical protein
MAGQFPVYMHRQLRELVSGRDGRESFVFEMSPTECSTAGRNTVTINIMSSQRQ